MYENSNIKGTWTLKTRPFTRFIQKNKKQIAVIQFSLEW